MVAVMQVDELPQDVPGAEALVLSHSEHKAELDTREASFTTFKRQGETLIAASHYASHEVSTYSSLLARSQIEKAIGVYMPAVLP